jgi:hypothetical protein
MVTRMLQRLCCIAKHTITSAQLLNKRLFYPFCLPGCHVTPLYCAAVAADTPGPAAANLFRHAAEAL